jgi:hypothetical protein
VLDGDGRRDRRLGRSAESIAAAWVRLVWLMRDASR